MLPLHAIGRAKGDGDGDVEERRGQRSVTGRPGRRGLALISAAPILQQTALVWSYCKLMTSWFLLRPCKAASAGAPQPTRTGRRHLDWSGGLFDRGFPRFSRLEMPRHTEHPREEKLQDGRPGCGEDDTPGYHNATRSPHDKRLSQHHDHEDLARRPSRSLVLFGSRAVHTTIAVFSKLVSRLDGDFRGGFEA